jgi:hypothetical protein
LRSAAARVRADFAVGVWKIAAWMLVAHVATCSAKLGTDLYFGSHELFEKAQRKQQHDTLVSFLKTVARN